MLSPEACRSRCERLWELVPEQVEWILISDPKHLTYLANWRPSPFEFRSDQAAAVLILGRQGSSTLVADNLLEPYAQQVVADEVCTPTWYCGKSSAPDRGLFLIRNTLEQLRTRTGNRFGIEAGRLPAGIVEGLRQLRHSLELTEISAFLRQMRRIKDADEIELLRRSAQAGEAGFAAAALAIEPGITEFDLYLLVQSAAQEALGEQALIYGDFASGPRCMIGGPPTHRQLEPGDPVLFDFSVVLWNYRADLARTFICGTEPTAHQVEVHDVCIEALAAGENLLRAGTRCEDLDRTVRGVLEQHGLGAFHQGHLGHGIGLGHPEPPFIIPESKDVLVVGDVVTLEPGVYIPGKLGLRIERNYIIGSEGFEPLCQHEVGLTPREH